MNVQRPHCPACTRECIRALIGLDVKSSRLLWVCLDCTLYWDLTGQPVAAIERRLWREDAR